MNKALTGFVLSLIAILLLVFKYAINKKTGTFTCKKYIMNTYLYVILSFILLSLLITLLNDNNVSITFTGMNYLALFLILIGLVISLNFIVPDTRLKMVIKHIVWLVILLLFALQLSLLVKYTSQGILSNALLTTGLLVLVLTAIAFLKPEWISLKMGPILFFLLLAGIIFEASALLFFREQYLVKNKWLYKVAAYGFIALFMGFLLYDTKRLQVRARACKIADYIRESFSIFLDILNLFLRILSLNRI
jgi:FtsH-binding integral membrane protein